MTIAELYDKLEDKDFQEYETGNLFFPAYMYRYDIKDEYAIEKEIADIGSRLLRPSSYLHVLILDIYEELMAFLKTQSFGKDNNKLDYYLQFEANNPNAVQKAVGQEAYSKGFLDWLSDRISEHITDKAPEKTAYVFMKGIGKVYPYLRVSRFMSNFEKHIKGFKLIVFYPGEVKGGYSLFGLLKDDHLYRAIKLINE